MFPVRRAIRWGRRTKRYGNRARKRLTPFHLVFAHARRGGRGHCRSRRKLTFTPFEARVRAGAFAAHPDDNNGGLDPVIETLVNESRAFLFNPS